MGSVWLRLADLGPGTHFLVGVNEVEPATGSNGAGKSTLLDALVWCLYGRTVEGLRNPDIKPWDTDDKTVVRLWLRVDGKEHVVRRSANPNKLTLDGEVCDAETIVKTIGMTVEVFLAAVILGQHRKLFLDLEPREKMDLFGEVMDLTRWDYRSETCGARSKKFKAEFDASERLEGMLGLEVKEARKNLKRYTAALEEAESAGEDATREARKSLKAVEPKLEKATTNRDAADVAYDSAMTELKAVRLDITTRRTALDKLRQTKVTAELVHERQRMQWEAAVLAKQSNKNGAKCATCGQPMPKKLAASLDQRRGDSIIALKDAMLHAKAEMKTAVDRFMKVERTLNIQEEARDRLEKQADAAQQALKLANDMVGLHSGDVAKARHVIGLAERGVDIFRERESDARVALRKTKSRLAEAEADSDHAWKLHRRYAFWQKAFKDVRLFLIEDVLEHLQLVTDRLLGDVGLAGWRIVFSIAKEAKSGKSTKPELNVTVLSPRNKKQVAWASFSGGQRQRLRIVGSLAFAEVVLRRSGVECPLIVLDEPTQHMSPEGIRDLASMLAERGRQSGQQIIYVDHQAVMSKQFASVITVRWAKSGVVLEHAPENHFNFPPPTSKGVKHGPPN